MNKSLSKIWLHILIFIIGIVLLAGLLFKGHIFHTDQTSIISLVDQTDNIIDPEIQKISLINIQPMTFAISNDQSFWVAGQKKLIHFSTEGESLAEILVDQQFNALTVYNDKIFFAATDKQIVQFVFKNYHWEQKNFALLDSEPFITSLCISDDQLYVADAGNKKVHAFDLQNNHIWSISGKDKFIVPSPYFDVAPESRGGVWVVNPAMHRIENYDKHGNFKAFWEPEQTNKFLGCCNPAQIAVLSGDRFVTLEKGIVQCRIFSPSGKLEQLVATKSQLVNPKLPPDNRMTSKKFNYELAVKSDGSIVVLDADRKMLLVFDISKQRNESTGENAP